MEGRLIKAAIVYGAALAACLALYWGSMATGALGGGGIMGYTLLALYCVLPLAGAIAAFLVGRAGALGPWRLAAPLAVAGLYRLFIAATFDLSNALGLTKIAAAEPVVLLYSLVPAAIGLAIGWATSLRVATE